MYSPKRDGLLISKEGTEKTETSAVDTKSIVENCWVLLLPNTRELFLEIQNKRTSHLTLKLKDVRKSMNACGGSLRMRPEGVKLGGILRRLLPASADAISSFSGWYRIFLSQSLFIRQGEESNPQHASPNSLKLLLPSAARANTQNALSLF